MSSEIVRASKLFRKYYIYVYKEEVNASPPSEFISGEWEMGQTLEEDKQIRAEVDRQAKELAEQKGCPWIPLGLCKDTFEKYDFQVPYHTWVWGMAHHFDPLKRCGGGWGVLSWAALEKRCQVVEEGFRLEWHHFDVNSYLQTDIDREESKAALKSFRLQFDAWRNAN